MIVWGGYAGETVDLSYCNAGWEYDIDHDMWTTLFARNNRPLDERKAGMRHMRVQASAL